MINIAKNLLLGVVIVVMFSWLLFYNYSSEEKVVAIVEEIRYSEGVESEKIGENDGHPIAGAILGGYNAGLPGAIAGGIIGSEVGRDKGYMVSVRKLNGCLIRAKSSNGMLFEDYYPNIAEGAWRCSELMTLKSGDTIFLTKSTRLIWRRGDVTYSWRGLSRY